MPMYQELGRQSDQNQVFGRAGALLLVLLAMSSQAMADLNPDHAMDVDKVTSIVEVNDVAQAHLVIVPELMPLAGVGDGAVKWTRSRILKEVGKQAIDQPGHFLIGGAPIWASRYLLGVPWLGWAAAPVIAYREWLQWPSNRWWDPPLDWAFFTLGAVAATWSRRPGHRLVAGLAAIRQSVASALAVRGRVRHAA